MTTWTSLGIILMIAGFILVGIEIVLPGFSVPGIAGCICLVLSVFLNSSTILEAVCLTIGIVVILGIMLAIMLRLLSKGKLVKGVILTEEQTKDKGYISADKHDELLHQEGIAITDLRPSGIGEFSGKQFDVISNGSYISKETPIVIYQIEGAKLLVKEIKHKDVV